MMIQFKKILMAFIYLVVAYFGTSLGAFNTYGKDKTVSSSTSREFCKNGVDNLMEKLNSANEKNFNTIKDLRTQIDKANAEKTALGQMQKITDNYLTGAQALSSTEEKGDAEKMKSVIQNGLMIKMFEKEMSESSDNKEATKATIYPSDFNQSLANLFNDLDHSDEPLVLKKKLLAVIAELPDEISPREIMPDELFACLEDKKDNAKNCQQLTNNFLNKLAQFNTGKLADSVKKSHDKLIERKNEHLQLFTKSQNTELQKALNSDEFKAIEKLKKYVAEKYLRSCSKQNKVDSTKITLGTENLKINSPESPCSQQLNVTDLAFNHLTGDVSEIIQKTYFAENLVINTPKNEEDEFIFSKEEMANFSDSCILPKIKKDFKEICHNIDIEITKRKRFKDSAYWEKLNDKYWVQYDDSSPRGYELINKRSNLEIVGRGLLPIIPTLIPMWLDSFVAGQQIDYLTNQAIYNKQMIHTMNIYDSSPWMYPGYFTSPYYYNTNGFGNSTVGGTGYNFGTGNSISP